MALSADLSAAVDQAFAAAGDLVQAMTLRRQAQGAYTPSTGEQAQTQTDYATQGIIVARDTDSNGQEGPRPAIKAVINASDISVVPQSNDHLIVNSAPYLITRVQIAKPGAVAFVYRIEARL